MAVAIDFVRWRVTFCQVKPGHVVNWLFWRALSTVVSAGKTGNEVIFEGSDGAFSNDSAMFARWC